MYFHFWGDIMNGRKVMSANMPYLLLIQLQHKVFYGLTKIEGELGKRFGSRLYCWDNFSDEIGLWYTKQFIQKSDPLKVLIWDEVHNDTNHLFPILNSLMRKNNVDIHSNTENKKLIILLKKLNYQPIEKWDVLWM